MGYDFDREKFDLSDEPTKSSPRIVEIEDSDNEEKHENEEKIAKTVDKITTEAENEAERDSRKRKHKKHNKDKSSKDVKEVMSKSDNAVVFTDESSPKNILEVDEEVVNEEKQDDGTGVDYVD